MCATAKRHTHTNSAMCKQYNMNVPFLLRKKRRIENGMREHALLAFFNRKNFFGNEAHSTDAVCTVNITHSYTMKRAPPYNECFE